MAAAAAGSAGADGSEPNPACQSQVTKDRHD